MRRVGLVEHHTNGHWVMRGTFAGHYLDVDEGLHASERGAVDGFVGGAALGSLLGPPGLAAGMVLGAMIGSQIVRPSEGDQAPHTLGGEFRNDLPSPGSAIALIGDEQDVDEMLSALPLHGAIIRRTLTPSQAAALEGSLEAAPPASPGPSVAGEQAVAASKAAQAPQLSV